ncbi:MAG: electron transfer flavoprotein subunit alpha/FixB family protein [Thermodesulfobacteriaceae bacterium]|nr:electron transfer flavoprotein subunit alpha/FixB family protein [Thermodesulfobacteriaceae bacterium]MDW8136185.1 electron transfer flavoprotein subunit alpha/FixB family protein [Thermodesulfobacterium sp.]
MTKENPEVWVFVEEINSQIKPVSLELLGIGKKLATDLETKLGAILIGYRIKNLASELFSYGAEKVYLVEHPVLSYYRHEPFRDTLAYLAFKYKPDILLVPATPLGRDLAGGVATCLETGLTADVTELAIDKEKRLLLVTRPAYSGNLMATIICPEHRPQITTVRPRVFSIPEKRKQAKGELIEEKIDLKEENLRTQRIGFIPKERVVNLEYAEVIVAGGKGVGGKEGFSLLQELAKLLNGEVGASRLAVSAGWISHEHQVGQTGKTVRPKVYLAFGISGKIQHRVGMQNSDLIIAVNKDPSAEIFQIADLGIVGDWKKVCVALIEKIKRERKP